MPERSGLVTTAELAASLDQSNLRIFDCTTYLDYQPPGSDVPYIAVPRAADLRDGAYPGSRFSRPAG